MFSDRRSSCRVRHWSASAGLAAAAAAVIGMGTAHADDGSVPTDIGLLNTAQTDIAEAFSLAGHTNADASFFPELEAIQTPLLSSDNSFFSGFGEALFNGPDQQLAQSSEAFLSAAEALSSATPGISELGVLGDYASTGFQVTDAIFGEIPSTLIGKLTDQIFDIGGFDTASASAATDLASSASSASDLTADAAGSPDAVLGQAVSDLSQGVSVLEAAPTADLSADQLNFFTSQETPITTLEPFLTQIGSLQDSLPSADQAFVLGADEQLVTAAQAVLSADQALVVADQAGDLGGTLNTFDIGVLDADLGLVSSYFTVIGDDIIAPLFTDFGIPLP